MFFWEVSSMSRLKLLTAVNEKANRFPWPKEIRASQAEK